MIKKALVLICFIALMTISISEAIALEKKPSDSLRFKQIMVILLQPRVLGYNILPNILISVDALVNDSNNILKKLGDIPIAKPGTRD